MRLQENHVHNGPAVIEILSLRQKKKTTCYFYIRINVNSQMLGSMQTETEMGRKFLESATMPDLCKVGLKLFASF